MRLSDGTPWLTIATTARTHSEAIARALVHFASSAASTVETAAPAIIKVGYM
jgi:hypothetical protein